MSSVHAFDYGLNNTNNGVLSGIKAMPLKDLNSDSDSSFAADRKAYANMVAASAQSTNAITSQKKWIGGSRDASSVASRRRIAAAGATMNPDGGSFSFTSKTEKNTRIEALNRCRNQGKCAPPKVTNSPHYTNVPATYWPKAPLIRTVNRAALPLYYLGTAVNT